MDKQQALNQLRIMRDWHEDNGDGPNADYDAICYAIGVIEEMPEGMDTLIKALEEEHKKLLELQDVPPEKCEKCMMEHMDEMEKLEVELEMQKAQPEQRWIPVTERLPEKFDYYLVSGINSVWFARYERGQFLGILSGHALDTVIAWMPLPKPWEGDAE